MPEIDVAKTNIANIAISMLGSGYSAKRIKDIDDEDNPLAVDCKFWLGFTIKEVLAETAADWSFALKRAQLEEAELAEGGESEERDEHLDFGGWLYAYALPDDFVRFVKSLDASFEMDENREKWTTQYRFKREGRFILSNESEFYLNYIFENDDPATWPIKFTFAVACMLAYHLADSILKSPVLAEGLLRRYETYYKLKAIRENASTEYTEDEEGNNDCLNAGRI